MRIPYRFAFHTVCAALALAGYGTARATQAVTDADRRVQQVTISAVEFNRMSMDGGRHFAEIVPAQPGSISYTKDASSIWLKPSNPTALNETITLFVTDDTGVTYRLSLVPTAKQAEDIRIEPPKRGSDRRGLRATSFERQVKKLILAMAGGEGALGLESTQVNQPVSLWKEAQLTLARRYAEGEFVGEVYSLSNISRADMMLDERELYARGVVAIAIENASLPAGASTNVYVVRERGENE